MEYYELEVENIYYDVGDIVVCAFDGKNFIEADSIEYYVAQAKKEERARMISLIINNYN